ncbi:hypothetical protein [uncultured Nitratireductor sp.]|uniref:hypothetical protein n=1 Tax=uncultured Nitratireductor sp. TaxID=520953 RepID=UPI0025DD8F6D|nr:hypothetical protein [uncultured Nitratireductor sp.]
MTEVVNGEGADKRLMKFLVREMGGHSVVIVRDGKRMIGWCSGKSLQSIAMSDLRAAAIVPALTDEAVERAKAAYWNEVHYRGAFSDKPIRAALLAAFPSKGGE